MGKTFTKTSLAFVLCALMALSMFSGCSKPEEEPAAIPVVVAPEPEPEPEPEPPKFYYPLTGFEVEDESLTYDRPLSVKIENTPESRPALGITHADVVYETITEGGITRFNAIFQSDIPEAVGSVRSARNSDITIVPEYDALFVFSGTNSLVWEALGRTWINYIEEGTSGKSLYRVNHKAGPHNLYLNTERAFARMEERTYPLTTSYPKGLAFGEQDTSSLGDANDAIEIFVPFSGSLFDVTWTYNAATGKYMRFIRGVAQCDEGDATAQIMADNIVALSVPYVPAPFVPNKGQTYNLDFTGRNYAIVFRDGVKIDCFWETDGSHPPVFTDLSGNPVLLKPGKTWFQVPTDIGKIVVTTGHTALDDPQAAAEAAASSGNQDYRAADAADVNE